MRLSGASLFPLAIAALLAGLTFWLQRAMHSDEAIRSGKFRHDPDFIVERFDVRQFGPNGALRDSMTAEKMVHYPDDDTTLITAPTFKFYGTPPMQITARNAWMGKDGKEVRLEDDVRAVRAGEDGQPESVLTTRLMYVYPDDELARTDVPVTFTQGHSVLDAGGFEADNKRQLYLLTGPVRGTFTRPEKNKPN